MRILAYDISDDKLRTRFSKFIMQYGNRLQFSVYQIRNSERVLQLIESRIKGEFEKKFTQDDSVLILNISSPEKILRFGKAKNEEGDLLTV